MFEFICTIFFGIGLAVSIFFIVTRAFEFISRQEDRARERKEKFTRIISALERIEANTRNKPNHG